MRLDRTDPGRAQHATGIITPLLRASGHVGWITGVMDPSVLPEDGYTDTLRTAINNEIIAALEHLETVTPSTPFVSNETFNAQAAIAGQLRELATDLENREDVANNALTILHNMAGVVARYERDTSGTEADPGTQP